jgi:hypothetical protein
MMFPRIMILYAWIQCLADAVDCEIYIILHIRCKSLYKKHSCYFQYPIVSVALLLVIMQMLLVIGYGVWGTIMYH